MNAEQSITSINGYALSAAWTDNEPRVRDVELAERLGYARPAKERDRANDLERLRDRIPALEENETAKSRH